MNKNNTIGKLMVFLTFSLLFIFGTSCTTHRPYIDVPKQSYQQKLNTGHDWHLMANDAASKLKYNGRKISLEFSEENTVFAKAYKKIITQSLVNQGFTVVDNSHFSDSTLHIDYTMLKHGNPDEKDGFIKRIAVSGSHIFSGDHQGKIKYIVFGERTGAKYELIVGHTLKNQGTTSSIYTAIVYVPKKDNHLYTPKFKSNLSSLPLR
jgi:hypothetical protein